MSGQLRSGACGRWPPDGSNPACDVVHRRGVAAQTVEILPVNTQVNIRRLAGPGQGAVQVTVLDTVAAAAVGIGIFLWSVIVVVEVFRLWALFKRNKTPLICPRMPGGFPKEAQGPFAGTTVPPANSVLDTQRTRPSRSPSLEPTALQSSPPPDSEATYAVWASTWRCSSVTKSGGSFSRAASMAR